VDYFINLMKSCTLRIGAFPIDLFLNEVASAQQNFSEFPLLSQTLRFYNYKENMVQTTVRNIFLGIVKNKSSICQDFISAFPYVKYFVFLVCFARDNWFRIDQKLVEAM